MASFLAIRIRASQNDLIPLHRLLGSTVEEGSAAADDDYDYDDGSDDDGDDDDDDDDDGDGDGDSDCWLLQNMGDAYLGLGSADLSELRQRGSGKYFSGSGNAE